MNDAQHGVPMPAEEDPLIHRYVGGLSRFAPASPHFQDRVLACVRRPEPEWLTELRARRRELARSRGTWTVLGVMTVGAAVSTTAVIVLAGVFRTEVAAGVGWLFATGLPFAWDRLVAEASQALAPLGPAARSIAPTGTALAWRATGLAAVLAGCALGLARAMWAQKVVAS